MAAEEAEEMVGPAPPEVEAEAEATGADERTREVIRIISVLVAAAREPSQGGAAAAAPEAGTDVSADLKVRWIQGIG